MKKLIKVILFGLLIFSLTGSSAYLFIISSAQNTPAGNFLTKTTPLEKYMFQNYDSKGYNGYTLVIAIEQPVIGSRDIANEDMNNGHAFIRLAKNGEKGWVSYFSYNVDPLSDDVDSKAIVDIHKDALNKFTIAKVYEISEKDSQNTLKYFWSKYKKPDEYDIAYNNCVSFALNAVKSAGIKDKKIGIVPRKWQIPKIVLDNPIVMYYINSETKNYFGYSAGDAVEDMKNVGGVIYYEDLSQ